MDQLAHTMPWSMFRQWQSYWQVEPPSGGRIQDSIAMGFTILCSLVATIASRKRVTYKVGDFIPKYGRREAIAPDAAAEGQARWLRQKAALIAHGKLSATVGRQR